MALAKFRKDQEDRSRILNPALTEPFRREVAPGEAEAAQVKRRASFGGLGLERPVDVNQQVSALRGPSIQADITRPESIVPVGAGLRPPTPITAPGVTAQPEKMTPPPGTPLPVSTPPVTARELFPGVTEVTAPDSNRAFTNLLPGSASPEQATGFRNAMLSGPSGGTITNPQTGETITVPPTGGLRTPSPESQAIVGQMIAQQDQEITDQLVREGKVAPQGQVQDFGYLLGQARQAQTAAETQQPGESRTDLLRRKQASAEAMGTVGGFRAAAQYGKQLAAIGKEDRAERTTAVQEGNLAVTQAKALKELSKPEALSKMKVNIVPPGQFDAFGAPAKSTVTLGDQEYTVDPAGAVTLNNEALAKTQQFFAENPDSARSFEEVSQRYLREMLRANPSLLSLSSAEPATTEQ